MNTRGLLDQLLKSGQDMLQNKAGGQRKSNDKGALGGLLSGGGLGSMLGGAGGGALAAGAMGLLLGNTLVFSAGIPLRKNSVIALLDRYVVGGASSVWAFPPRFVGPGSTPRDTSTGGLTVGRHTGNVLLEGSVEYRMPIGKYPELAFFFDAGNVWLTSGPDAQEGSRFRLSQFYRELAAGAGIGLRVNFGFFIVRLDVAVPLSKPYLPVGERWVGDNLEFGSRNWRRENLNWNFSFGYPF